MSSYTPKYEMPKGFTLGGQLVNPERYDQLVDKFPETFRPRVEYFQALKREKEEKESLAFLLEVSPKPTTQPPTETLVSLLTSIPEEPQTDYVRPVPSSLAETETRPTTSSTPIHTTPTQASLTENTYNC